VEVTPRPLDVDALPPIVLERVEVRIEGDRPLYSYSVRSEAGRDEAVSLESPEANLAQAENELK
jgi:hypothetical protein